MCGGDDVGLSRCGSPTFIMAAEIRQPYWITVPKRLPFRHLQPQNTPQP